MRILTRYVLKEVLAHAALGAGLFTFIVFMRDMSRILDLIVRNSAPLPSVAEVFFLTLPTAFTITIPMAVLLGILIGLSRLASDSEVTAMRASGMGAGTFVSIVAIFAVAAWLLALVNSVVVAPRSAAALVQLQNSLRNSQASFAVQPRVFYENFNHYVLYVQDAASGTGASVWSNVFLADIRNPSAPRIIFAEKAVVLNDENDAGTLRLHLTNGSQHETVPRSPDKYNISTYAESDIPIQLPAADTQKRREPPAAELTTTELLSRAEDADPLKARWYEIEFHRRLALPTACLVLALVGIPLGLSSKKGGKSTGFVLTIVLVFAYYLVSLLGLGMARQGKLPPAAGVWMANLVFAIAGVFLVRRVDCSSLEVGSVSGVWKRLKGKLRRRKDFREERRAAIRLERQVEEPPRFAQILDTYVLTTFLGYLAMILSTFLVLTMVFTFFELLSDIIRNKVSLITVGLYLVNLMPSMIYLMAPMSVLLAVLVTLTLMQNSNELTAMKATGISIYRAIIPLLAVAFVLALGLFFFEHFYIPEANTRQEALRNSIKGKPAQTVLRPDRQWIFGQKDTIYHYEHFDPDQNKFAGITAFQFDPQTFAITRRTYAQRAHWEEQMQKWVFQQGWSRTFNANTVEAFERFDVATIEHVTEMPSYFKKEVRLSSEMNYSELSRYIKDLQQSGFDVVRLRVQLHKKFAYPLIAFVMAVLAVPFALSGGRRGALAGVGVAVGIAAVYWITSGIFESLGNVNQLPAVLAAWAPDFLFGLAGGYLIFKVRT